MVKTIETPGYKRAMADTQLMDRIKKAIREPIEKELTDLGDQGELQAIAEKLTAASKTLGENSPIVSALRTALEAGTGELQRGRREQVALAIVAVCGELRLPVRLDQPERTARGNGEGTAGRSTGESRGGAKRGGRGRAKAGGGGKAAGTGKRGRQPTYSIEDRDKVLEALPAKGSALSRDELAEQTKIAPEMVGLILQGLKGSKQAGKVGQARGTKWFKIK